MLLSAGVQRGFARMGTIGDTHPLRSSKSRKGETMSVLYRRFMLVAAMIAALGVLTANLIQETRRDVISRPAVSPELPMLLRYSCNGDKTCALSRSFGTLVG